jgi:hypothetical protein
MQQEGDDFIPPPHLKQVQDVNTMSKQVTSILPKTLGFFKDDNVVDDENRSHLRFNYIYLIVIL